MMLSPLQELLQNGINFSHAYREKTKIAENDAFFRLLRKSKGFLGTSSGPVSQ
ncbi:hypothetical protein [Paenibacillus dendritiformis]|uniref:hypothetical protein n=1 Tax=Paenibacillus dendritiformis TaxID=130049 RepID=UPI0020C456B9|nr:hypothetical protein [Paenibacillus dendritiformis]CAH8771177.1 hypothetical protein H7S4_003912 [Paenibacillus dendritiformis]